MNRRLRAWRFSLKRLSLGAAVLFLASAAEAQNSSLYSPDVQKAQYPPARRVATDGPRVNLEDSSWIHVPTPPPREIQKHDIVSVRVDLLARMSSEGELRRRKGANYDATLKDWVIFDGLRWVKPSPQSNGPPRARGELKSQYRSLGELETAESMAFNLASEVVDIRPNGNLVLEGRSNARINDEVWTITLSGLCRPESIGPNNVVLSRDIIDLDIQKVETGSVAVGYQRGWFQKIFDLIQPF
ncbi:MAG: flagellar basal body L-ring protein FlgH [Pirellulaceae bacterium]